MVAYVGDWRENVGLAERLTHSSFSVSKDDYWAQDVVRPFQIVVLPGYRIPSELDRTHKDAIWVTPPTSDTVVVWDGYSVDALHEVILECMDPTGESDFIKVRNAKTGEVIPDRRPAEVMAVRPTRSPGLSPKQIVNHVLDLWIWTGVFSPQFGNEGRETRLLYELLFVATEARDVKSLDGSARIRNFDRMREIHGKGPADCRKLVEKSRCHPPVKPQINRGPVGTIQVYRADKSSLHDYSWSARKKWLRIDLDAAVGKRVDQTYYDLVRPAQAAARVSAAASVGAGSPPSVKKGDGFLARILNRKK